MPPRVKMRARARKNAPKEEKTAVKTRKTNVFLKKCVDLFAQVCYNALDL
jgi:hypothetical protein